MKGENRTIPKELLEDKGIELFLKMERLRYIKITIQRNGYCLNIFLFLVFFLIILRKNQ